MLYQLRFHECDGTVTEMDRDVEADDPAAVRRIAVDRARAIMADEVRQGRLCLSCWIVISDARGHHVGTLQFGDALEFKADPPCGHATEREVLDLPGANAAARSSGSGLGDLGEVRAARG